MRHGRPSKAQGNTGFSAGMETTEKPRPNITLGKWAAEEMRNTGNRKHKCRWATLVVLATCIIAREIEVAAVVTLHKFLAMDTARIRDG